MIKEIAFADQDKEIIVSLTIRGYDIDQIKTYLSEFVEALQYIFNDNVKPVGDLKKSKLPNKDTEIVATVSITNQRSIENTKNELVAMYDGLTMWSITKDLVIDTDINFEVK